MGMMFVSIEHDIYKSKDYIRFCSDTECIMLPLTDRHLSIYPFPGGKIPQDYLPHLIDFLKESYNETKENGDEKGFVQDGKEDQA